MLTGLPATCTAGTIQVAVLDPNEQVLAKFAGRTAGRRLRLALPPVPAERVGGLRVTVVAP